MAWQKILDKGLLGNVENMTITSLSGYHAVSIIRKYMEAGFENCSIIGDAHTFHVTKTKTRGGACYDGEVVQNHRHRLTLSFENGKTAFYDFQSVQAHTYIRTRQLNIQGVRGEIDDLEVRYLTDDNVAVKSQLNRVDAGVYHNSEWSHVGIMLHDEYLYKNPFINARLNDDELAMAECMFKMSEYVKTGKEFYSLREALQDTYLSIKMTEAVNHPYTEIKTEKKLWCE